MENNFNRFIKILDIITDISQNQNVQSHLKDYPFLDFEGIGSIGSQILKENHPDFQLLKNKISDLENILNKPLFESIKQSVLTSFYTPEDIIEAQVVALKKLADKENYKIHNILDPSSGNGRYITFLRKHFPLANIYALEKDTFSSALLKYNFLNDSLTKTKAAAFEDIDQLNFPKKFDLIISNIPFGNIKVFDPNIASEHSKNIHNYFFVKAATLSHENTIISYLTSTGFLDATTGKKTREFLDTQFNLVSAIRLPNHVFKNANTRVVTDLVTLQHKSDFDTKYSKWIENDFDVYNPEDSSLLGKINQYFQNNPNILGSFKPGGMYRKDDFTLISQMSIEEIALKLSQTLSDSVLHKSLDIQPEKSPSISTQSTPSELAPSLPKKTSQYLQEGNIVIDPSGKLLLYSPDSNTPLSLSKPDVNRVASIINLRNLYNQIKLSEYDSNEFKKLMEEFNYSYDQFYFQYDLLNNDVNKRYIDFDSQSRDILSFESYNSKKYWEKSSKFNPDFYKPVQKQTQTYNYDYQTAITLSLNKNNSIDFDYITELTGVDKDTFIEQALKKQLIFPDPHLINGEYQNSFSYVPQNIFLSGHIQNKINFFKSSQSAKIPFLNKSYIDYLTDILEEVKPSIIPFDQLNAQPGESWIPIKVISDFILDTYNVPVNIQYNDTLDNYFVGKIKDSYLSYSQRESYNELAQTFTFQAINSRYYHFENFLESLLNTDFPVINKTISKDPVKSIIYKPHMIKYQQKVNMIDKAFFGYVMSRPDVKENLEKLYYDKYLAHLKASLSGNHLNFDFVKPGFNLYPDQKDAAMTMIQNMGGIVDHKVGYGKTFTAVITALKLKEMNKISKPMMLCLPANIFDIEKNIKDVFPSINILTALPKDFKNSNIDAFLLKVKNESWDMVLISHENYKKIKQNPEVQKEIIFEQIDNIDRDLEALDLSFDKISNEMKKGLLKRKNNLVADLKKLNSEISKEQVSKVRFDQIGVDFLLVDESHKFKNLSYTTRHSRVAGLNTEKGSQRAFNLLTGVRTLQKHHQGDKGTVFLSGTTISNSITELYAIFKYLIPNKLIDLNVKSFDQWVKVFGIKNVEIENTLSGNYQLKERFREFKKVPELSAMYNKIAHVAHASLEIDVPSPNVKFLKIDPYKEQELYFEDVKQFARTGETFLLNDPLKQDIEYDKGISLVAFNYMIKSALDLRIINSVDFSDHPDNRIRTLAKELVKKYDATSDFNGTQLVFIDKSTPKKGFNVYDELKNVLTKDYNIPSNQIEFIHDHEAKTKKNSLFQKVNKGLIRILLGSTEKLGTGVNVQERLIGIHHFDIPFKPSDFDQRNGRGIRGGNTFAKTHYNNTVDVTFYATTSSIDTKLFELNGIKQNFIKQILNNSIKSRTVDEGPFSVDSISFSSFAALTSTDEDYNHLQQLKKELDDLQTLKMIYDSDVLNYSNKLLNLNNILNSDKNSLVLLEKDLILFNEIFPDITTNKPEGDTEISKKIDLSKYSFYQPGLNEKDMFQIFSQKIEDALKNNDFNKTLFSYDIFDINLRGFEKDNYKIIVKTPNISYTHGSCQLIKNSDTMLNYPLNALEKVVHMVPQYQNKIFDTEKKIEAIQKVNINKFEDKDLKKMDELKKEINKLETKIHHKNNPTPKEESGISI